MKATNISVFTAYRTEQKVLEETEQSTWDTTVEIPQILSKPQIFNNFVVLKDMYQCHPTPTIHQGISLPWALVTKYNISLNILFILAYVLGNTLILENWLASSF